MADLAGLGTTLSLLTTGPSTYTVIAQRVSITGPSFSVGERDVTHLDSTLKEYKPTLGDPGELELEVYYDPNGASHILLTDMLADPTVETWKLEFQDTHTTHANVVFDAFLNNFSIGGIEEAGTITATVGLRLTGVPDFNIGVTA